MPSAILLTSSLELARDLNSSKKRAEEEEVGAADADAVVEMRGRDMSSKSLLQRVIKGG